MSLWLRFHRIVAPLTFRYAIPGLGNVWQVVLKESAPVSVTGLTELLRQSQVGAGSTGLPFYFYLIAGRAGARNRTYFSASSDLIRRGRFDFFRGPVSPGLSFSDAP